MSLWDSWGENEKEKEQDQVQEQSEEEENVDENGEEGKEENGEENEEEIEERSEERSEEGGDVLKGEGQTVPANILLFGPSPPCLRCHQYDHAEEACPACTTCCRLGHQMDDCPYVARDDDDGTIYCSNCGDEHLVTECPKGCQAQDCQSPARTWLHPHSETGMPAVNKAWIHGYSQATKSNDAPESTKIESINMRDPKPYQDRPSMNFASYDGATDTTFLEADTGEISVVANYVTVEPKITSVHVYSIVLADLPVDSSEQPGSVPPNRKPDRKRVFDTICQLPPLQGRDDFTTDYETIWLESPLSSQSPHVLSNVTYHDGNGREVIVPKVEIKSRNQLDFSRGVANIAGVSTPFHRPVELTKAINARVTRSIVNHSAETLFQSGANSFFLESNDTQPVCDSNGDLVDNALHIQRGYFTSIRPGTNVVLLNINVLHETFLKPTLVSDFLDNMSSHVGEAYGDPANLLFDRKVRIIYDQPDRADGIDRNSEANRVKVISDHGEVPQIQQFESHGKMCTVKQQFETQGIEITRFDLVCLNVGTASEPFWIPAELLELMPNQPFDEPLGRQHQKIMWLIADKHPAMDHALIQEEGISLLDSGGLDRSLFENTGKALLQVPATILPAPTIQYRNGSQEAVVNAGWEIDHEPFAEFIKPSFLLESKLCVLDFREPESKPTPGCFAQKWMEACECHGLLAPDWKIFPEAEESENVIASQAALPSIEADDLSYFNEIQSIMETFRDSLEEPKFIVVLLPAGFDPKAFAAIKRIGDTKLGIHTICCSETSEVLEDIKGDMKAYDQMVLRQNLKAPDGQNHSVMNEEGMSAFAELSSNTLVIGVDVVHPGDDTPSIVAMVGEHLKDRTDEIRKRSEDVRKGSVDKTRKGSIDGFENSNDDFQSSTDTAFATFTGRIRLQPAEQEVLDQATAREIVRECIVKWQKGRPKDKLQRIIYYRDGVSDDQYDLVIKNEITAIQQAIDCEISGFDQVVITVIIVDREHHTSFFALNDSMTYEVDEGQDSREGFRKLNGNVKPGLLVDSVITQPPSSDFQDFFLQSHVADIGTARSTHYVVLRNDNPTHLTFKQLETITHAFCYNYAAATKAMPSCSPAYYAHLLCERAHHYMNSYLSTQKPVIKPLVGETLAAFRLRILHHIESDEEWVPKGNTNPWHSSMDEVMFWL